MIKYKLKCKTSFCFNEKEFDGWFKSIEAYENQKLQGLINCPICGSDNVVKSLTTPSLKINKNKFSVKNFAGLLYSGIYNKSTLIKHIRKMIKKDVSFEITFHPGSGCISEKNIFKKSHFKYVTSPMRKKELNLLTTTELDNIF